MMICIRAKEVFSESEINTDGLDSILKKYGFIVEKIPCKPKLMH